MIFRGYFFFSTINPHNEMYNLIMKKILVIEDEPDIRELLEGYLIHEGYAVDTAEDGLNGIDLFSRGVYDLVILDILMPKIDGYGVCEYIRKHSDTPVMFLSALGDESSVVKGYDLLADDYVTKPFSMPIFLKKVNALIRRNSSAEDIQEKRYVYKDIVMIPDRMECTVKGEHIELTAREYDLLLTFIKHPGRVYTRGILLDLIWDHDSLVDERIVDSHIKNLRHKLGGEYIDTVRGKGYRVTDEDQA
ncbi:two-component system, OmpR family, response regulator VanR [Ruminococcaceae bacterium KH2T8]|nr:two-component system, OmpR family, response regulator VanR [Ruminococcaceae bacterium KH2T8]